MSTKDKPVYVYANPYIIDLSKYNQRTKVLYLLLNHQPTPLFPQTPIKIIKPSTIIPSSPHHIPSQTTNPNNFHFHFFKSRNTIIITTKTKKYNFHHLPLIFSFFPSFSLFFSFNPHPLKKIHNFHQRRNNNIKAGSVF